MLPSMTSEEMTNRELGASDTDGAGQQCRHSVFVDQVLALVCDLVTLDDGAPASNVDVELTEKVNRLEREVADLRRILSGTKPVDELDDAAKVLFDELVVWRREAADGIGVQPFRILGNKVLAAIAVARPNDRFELSAVKGIGPDKMQYADGILAVVASHAW